MKRTVRPVKHRTTMADVARYVGVSPSAVSCAFAKTKSTKAVGKETLERIRKAAEELGYQPSILSRCLTARRSFSIAFLGRESVTMQIPTILQGLQEAIYDREYSNLVYYHGNLASHERHHLIQARNRQADAYIAVPALDPDGRSNYDFIQELQEEGKPVVQLFHHVWPNVPTGGFHIESVLETAFSHLRALGHRHIGFLPVFDPQAPEPCPGYNGDTQARVNMYTKRIRQEGFDPCILHTNVASDCPWKTTFDAGRKTSSLWLKLQPRPTAMIAINDLHAMGFIRGVQAAGLQVPRDVSVIGHDDMVLPYMLHPSLTTFRVPAREMGKSMAAMAVDMIDGKPGQDLYFRPELVLGESTGPCPR